MLDTETVDELQHKRNMKEVVNSFCSFLVAEPHELIFSAGFIGFERTSDAVDPYEQKMCCLLAEGAEGRTRTFNLVDAGVESSVHRVVDEVG